VKGRAYVVCRMQKVIKKGGKKGLCYEPIVRTDIEMYGNIE